jgi:hypothetical protein
MAISVLNSPNDVTQCYNPERYIVSSSIAATANQFRFICDVRDSSNNVVTRLKADKDVIANVAVPSGIGYFDVSSIVRTLIVPAKLPITTAGFLNLATPNGLTSKYSVILGEQYIDNTTNPPSVVTTGLVTQSDKYAVYNGLPQLDFINNTPDLMTTRYPTGSGATLTSYLPLVSWLTKYVYSDTYDWLFMGQNITSGNVITSARVEYFNAQNTLLRGFNVTAGGTTNTAVIKRFASGPMNIKALTSGQCSDGSAGSVLFPDYENGSYTIQFVTASSSPTIAVRYVMKQCTPYKKIGLWFVNKFGVIESFYFAYKNRKTLEINRNTFLRNMLSFVLQSGGGSTTRVYETTATQVYSGNQKPSWNLNSHILTESEYDWLQEMLYSPICFLDLSQITGSTTLVECVIATSSYNIVKRANDKQKSLNIQVDESYINNIL